MAEELVTYDQNGPGDPDPLGLEKKLAQLKSKADPLGLEAKLRATQQPKQEQPAFPIQLSAPTFKANQLAPVTPKQGAVIEQSHPYTYPKVTEDGKLVEGSISRVNLKSKDFSFDAPYDEMKVHKELGPKAREAHARLSAEMLGNDKEYEKKVREFRRDSYTIDDLKKEYAKSKMPWPDLDPDLPRYLREAKQRQYDLPVSPENISDAKTGTITNQAITRSFIKGLNNSSIQKDLATVDKFNDLANDPNGVERVDKVKDVLNRIGKGELVYDPEKKVVIKPLGMTGSLMEGVKNKFKADEEHDFFKNGTNAAIIKELESERNGHDSDEPVPVPRGKLNEFLKSAGEMPILPMVAGVAGTIGGTLIGNPELGTMAATALGAYENRKAQYHSTFKQVYNEMRDHGKSESDALNEARNQAENAQEIGTIIGAAQGYLGGKIGNIPINGASFNLGYQNAIGDFLKKNGSDLGKIVLDAAAQGGLGASGEVVKNKLAQSAGIKREWDEGVAGAFWGNALMTAGIGAAIKLGRGLSKINYKTILSGLTKTVPEEAINSTLQEKVSNGEITQAAADQALNEINQYKAKDAQIPANVTEEARFKIQDNIDKITELEQQKEATHKSLQGPIKERIDKLIDDNLALSKETVKPEKPVSGLSKDKEKEAIDFAHELVDEGILPDTYAADVKKDPIRFWQTVAQQAQNRDENWRPLSQPIEEQAVKDNYGETVVDYAKELFPAPEIPEPSKLVSVIQPGEIKQPETITIKPRENAIPEQISNEVYVREPSANGEAMGEGNSQPEIPSGEEAGIPTQEGSAPNQEGIGLPPTSMPEGKGVYVEHPETQLSFRGLQDTANEFGFEDVKSRDRVSDIQERKNAEMEVNDWVSRGGYQQNIDHLLTEIENRRLVPVARQRLILEQYLANEKQKARELPKNSAEYDAQILKLQRIKDIGQIARQEAGAALRLPDAGTLPHPIGDESDAMVAKMKANSVDKLTDQQKAEVEAQVEKYKERDEKAQLKIAELEELAAKMDAQKEFNKAKSTTKRIKKSAEERTAFRRTEIEAARAALKKLRTGESGLSSVPLPGVRELIAIAPHVKNIMVDLISEGMDNLQDVISHLHGEFKDVLDGLTEKNIHDIIAGEYNEKGKPLSELRRQINDIRDEAKYINQYEALVNGKEPKSENAKRERNRKIKEIKDKIKGFKQDLKESEKFYGESDASERKLDKLRDELDRIQERRTKEKPEKGSSVEKGISAREDELHGQIKDAQAEWDKEKEAQKQAGKDYTKLEAERNRQLQRVSDLKEKLDNLQRGVRIKGKSIKKVDTPEIEAFKEQVSDAEKELNKTIATEKRIKGLEEELDRLKQRKEKEPKETTKQEITDREKKLKEDIEAERDAFNKEKSEASKFYKEEIDDDAKKLIAIKNRNQKIEQNIKDKIAKGQFEKEVKKSIFDREDIKKNYPRLRKDALDAIAKKEEAQHEFDLALFNDEMAKRDWWQKTTSFSGKLIHTSKALLSGIDDSATFVQNGMAMLANPKMGAEVWAKHWKEAFSEARHKRESAALHADPDFPIMQKSELDIVEPHSAASKQVEEAFEQNLLAGKFKIGGKEFQPWKYTGGVFERAFTSMGNNFRVKLFKERMQMLREEGKTFESHPKEYKAAAQAINDLTGRAKLPNSIAQASPWLTTLIWAPRLLASTLNTLGLSDVAFTLMGKGEKGFYRSLTPTQRKFALGQLGKGIGMGVAVMGAASLAGAKVDYDPRSVTFGDIIIGDHHVNVFGRYTPVIKTIVQFAFGVRLKNGVPQDLDSGKFGAKTRAGVIGGFFRGKMTPAAGAAYDLAVGKNYYTGEKFTVKDLPTALLQPMSIKELRDGWANDGTATILNRFLPAFEGLKTSDERDFNKKGGSGGGAGATGSFGKAKKIKHTIPHKIHR